MSDAATAPAAPVKAAKKRAPAKPKKQPDHPKYSDMIKNALAALKVCDDLLLFWREIQCRKIHRYINYKLYRIVDDLYQFKQ